MASGDDPSTVQAVGLLATVVGVVLCSRSSEDKRERSGRLAAGVGLALLAALGGGITSTSLAEASSSGVLWVLLVQRATVGALALAIVIALRQSPRPPRHAASAIAAIGVIDLLATGLFTAATINGELSLVAVVGSLYPVVTVVLALVVLSERIERHQLIGAFTALFGVALISSG